MTIGEFLEALALRFPKYAGEISAWAPDYTNALKTMRPEAVAATFASTMSGWAKAIPPKPGELIRITRPTTGIRRHALDVDAPNPAQFPIGETDEERARWRYQNGAMFLARLAYWRQMRGSLGDDRAAEILKMGNDEDEIYRLFDQWRRAEAYDPRRRHPYDPQPMADVLWAISNAFAERKRVLVGGNAYGAMGDDGAEPEPPKPVPPSPAARARKAALQAEMDAHRRGIMDGSIPNPVYGYAQRAAQPDDALAGSP